MESKEMVMTTQTTTFWKKYFKYIHITIEFIVIIILLIYIFKSQRHLQNSISNLSVIVQEQQKILNQQNQIFETILLGKPNPVPKPRVEQQQEHEPVVFEAPPIEQFATLFTIDRRKNENETIIEEPKIISKDVIEKELENEIKELDEAKKQNEKKNLESNKDENSVDTD